MAVSTESFNKLFVGYPPDATTEALRARVLVAIRASLFDMYRAQYALPRITFGRRRRLASILGAVDMLPVYMLPDAPLAIKVAVERIRKPALQAMDVYSVAATQRRGKLRQTGRITEDEFLALRAVYIKVVDELIAWLEDVVPKR